jgi:predicted Zn-dependent protease/thioredoxin-like negative regulator of GroEL
LLEDRLDDQAGARGAYEEAIIVDDANRNAWLSLERVALREKDSALLHRSLLKLAELTQDPNRKARLLTEVAWDRAREGTEESLEQAAHLLQEAAGLPLGRWRALVEMERFAERTGRAGDLVFALEGRAALAGSVAAGEDFQGGSGSFAIARLQDAEEARQTAADLWARAARVRLGSLNDAEGAVSAMEQALALKPEDTRFRVYAMQLADLAGDTMAAAQHAAWLLEKNYGDPSTTASLHFRVAEAAAASDDMNAAGEALRKALAANGESPATLGALVDQMIAAGDGAGASAEFDRLAEGEENKSRKAALYRTSAMLSLAIAGDTDAASARFRKAAAEDPNDAISRRALLVLLATKAHGDEARVLLDVVDELLELTNDSDDRVVLLLEKLRLERFELNLADAAADTAQALVDATEGDRHAIETALTLRAAQKAFAPAAKLAEQLAEKSDENERSVWIATAARFHQAAGDEARARQLAFGMHKEAPSDPYLATMAFKLALAANDAAGALDVLLRKTDAAEDESATRWLLMGAVLLANAGGREESRRALERAAERSPASAAVRAALLATTRWRADGALRTRLAEAAIESPDAAEEEVALGVELVLSKIFLEHDIPAAMRALETVVAKAQSESMAVSLLNAIALGSQRGPDAEETVAALQGILNALPANDPVRVAIELEVARALSSSAATSDQAREVRQLLDDEQPQSVAPRLLALLDAIQREGRQDVPAALTKASDSADEVVAGAMRASALAALRAQGRETEARTLAVANPTLPAAAVALSEVSANLDQATLRADGLLKRMEFAHDTQRPGLARRAAAWSSLAARDEEAVAAVEALLADDPDDIVAWDILRVAGRRRALWPRVVESCVSLAERVRDPSRASALWEEAGVVYLDQIGNATKAEAALRHALENDPRRVLAYRRLREILEKRKDHVALEALVTTRIAATQEPEELAELLWEQARFRRAQGRREEALESAKNVVLLEPEHVAAWAMVAEVHASSGRLDEAADALSNLAKAKECPPANRKVARMGALDIYDKRLEQPEKAIEQLDALVAEGSADDKLVERGIDIATKAEL